MRVFHVIAFNVVNGEDIASYSVRDEFCKSYSEFFTLFARSFNR